MSAATSAGWAPSSHSAAHLGCGVVHHLLCCEVTLVAHKQLVHVFAGITVDLLQPLFNIVERLLRDTCEDV